MNIEVVWAPILISTVVFMVTGFFWYNPKSFGGPWLKSLGITKAEMKKNTKNTNMGLVYGLAMLAAFVTCYVLYHIIAVFTAGEFGIVAGMQGAFWCWLGFVLTAGGTNALFEQRPSVAFWINMGYNLVTLLLAGAIIGGW